MNLKCDKLLSNFACFGINCKLRHCAKELMFERSNEFPDRGVNAIAKFFREDQAGRCRAAD